MHYEIQPHCGGEVTALVLIDGASTDVLSVDTDDYALIHRELLDRARCDDGAAAALLRAEVRRGAVTDPVGSDLPPTMRVDEIVAELAETGSWDTIDDMGRTDWDIRVWGRDGTVIVRRAYRGYDVVGYSHEDPMRVAEHRRAHVRLARDLVERLQALAPGSALIEGAGMV